MPVVSSDTSPMLGQGWIVKLVVWMVPPVTLMNTREPSRGCFVTSHELHSSARSHWSLTGIAQSPDRPYFAAAPLIVVLLVLYL
jgi:hypothetical protein